MKNVFRIIGIIAIAAVIGLSIASCKEEEEEKKEVAIAKSIRITGFGSETGDVQLMIASSVTEDEPDMVAMGEGTISNKSVTVALIDLDEKPWTGSGSYIVGFMIEEDIYVYTNGQNLTNVANLPKVNISDATTTIAFSKFKIMED